MKNINKELRVMTYNVHSCRGIDGKVLPDRIAQVIDEYNPDIVALQELDVNRSYTGHIDQPSRIADYLRMQCHFQPAIAIKEERYGIAILSRHPFEIIKAEHLDRPIKKDSWKTQLPLIKFLYEPREAILAQVMIEGKNINFLNTHLGLRARERALQIDDILSDNWLGKLETKSPVIFCGDFNAGPKSSIYNKLKNDFKEAKASLKDDKTRKTFFSLWPIFELDHMFYSGDIKIKSVSVPSTQLTRMASDHLPVIANFEI